MNAKWQTNLEGKEVLREYGRDLIALAKENKLEPVINRDEEIRRLIRILSRKTKNNPVLVGEPGTGKTAIVEGLARKIVEKQVPNDLLNKELWEIDLSAMIAGAMYQGQFEERLKKLIDVVEKSEGNILLFIDEIHMLVGAGKNNQSAMDAANIFKPLMARGILHLIGATTNDEYRQYIETDAALERRMQKIYVNEPTVEDTITILRGIKERFEAYHGVKITDQALVVAAQLSDRYITERFLPDKAIDLIDEAAATIKTEMNSQPEELEIASQHLARAKMAKLAIESDDSNPQEKNNKLIELNKEITELDTEVKRLTKQWNNEKELFNTMSNIKDEIDYLKNKQQLLLGEGKYTEASKIMYGTLPSLEKKLEENELKINNLNSKLVKESVDEDEVAEIVAKWTKIPVAKLLKTEINKILNLESELKENIKGQDNACHLVSQSILRSKAGVNDPRQPLGTFLFLGPTGVGKTELSRKLASALFDDENKLIRLDMSEYMEKHTVSKLIGSPPGYIGFNEGGHLTELIRRNPYSIVLFDEIEKAHPDVLNILLQIMDNGNLTDSRGKFINFRNTIIIMTSNIASTLIANKKHNMEIIKKELLKHLRPEFLNRIDNLIAFDALTKESIHQIVELELNNLAKRLKKHNNYYIEFTNDVIDKIANDGYNYDDGARVIKRYIKEHIENLLAVAILKNEIHPEEKVKLKISNNEFVLDL
ncbi:ATP-dependent Clp protease ATP-binding subunit [Mycoplasma phocoenae]|uniref:AAA domain-containing protein n=1 Tax=Mycoplasma phocoenae TaxID=754517 RepID=A0A858U8F1_9MOLU|nr:AAA family ATPase [Mycoplasma phocoenae]QJG66996.1 AAA domain-containing protein [Mycoplasma phocoenae]